MLLLPFVELLHEHKNIFLYHHLELALANYSYSKRLVHECPSRAYKSLFAKSKLYFLAEVSLVTHYKYVLKA